MKKGAVALLSLLFVLSLSFFPLTAQGSQGLTMSTSAATAVTDMSATLNGCGMLSGVQQNPWPFSGYFKYGTQPGLLSSTTSVQQLTIPAGQTSVCYSRAITGLSPCTRYYAQAVSFAVTKRPDADSFFLALLVNPQMRGAGIGADPARLQESFIQEGEITGNVISFTTTGCPTYIGTGPTSHQSGGFNGTTTTPTTNLSNIVVQSATITSTKVSPGEKVDVTATVINKGNSNGTSKVILYIDGQVAESRGITLTSGESTQVHFSVSQNDPGTYSVYVNGIPAGNLTVDMFTNNDALIYGVIALFTVGIIGVLYLVVRRRAA